MARRKNRTLAERMLSRFEGAKGKLPYVMLKVVLAEEGVSRVLFRHDPIWTDRISLNMALEALDMIGEDLRAAESGVTGPRAA